MKILIVDDREENLYLLETLLKGSGYEVISAKDGLEALAKLKEEPIDLIISDILMPRMDGFQLCRECNKDDSLKKMPFIFYTATYTDKKDEEFALSLGADRFIVKPQEPEIFLKLLKEAIEEHKKGALVAPKEPIKEEEIFFEKYNKRLVHKLEKKMLDLKKSNRAIQEGENRFRGLFNNMSSGVAIYEVKDNGKDFIIKDFNQAAEKIEKVKKKDIIGKSVLKVFPGVKDFGLFKVFQEVYKTGKPQHHPISLYKDQKITGWRENYIYKLPSGEIAAVYDDITERKQAEDTIKRQLAEITHYYKNIPIGLAVLDCDLHFLKINDILAQINGIPAEEHINKTVKEIVPSLELQALKISAEILQTGEPVKDIKFSGETLADPGVKHAWLEGWYPVKDDSGKITGFSVIVQDITERKQAEEKLKKTLDATIETISRIAETRDPYTSGHQQRVSQLSIRIAREMHLSQEQIETIRIAALIHDIGKISIPSEILTKPGKLSDIEFSLIKSHSQTGYDILKGIDFPYPIIQIILQHHERNNGLGYPNRLTGDEILLEAKIIGVADVVEAMSSHRPYRPALGVEAALEEITKNKGILYDPEIVDVCVKLFKEKGFKFE
jgi:PAS domain S-box-containing protein/putative nucleotidyltransferase with HDIG domain